MSLSIAEELEFFHSFMSDIITTPLNSQWYYTALELDNVPAVSDFPSNSSPHAFAPSSSVSETFYTAYTDSDPPGDSNEQSHHEIVSDSNDFIMNNIQVTWNFTACIFYVKKHNGFFSILHPSPLNPLQISHSLFLLR